MAANAESGSADRPITGEPLYILFNLGMSEVSSSLPYTIELSVTESSYLIFRVSDSSTLRN